MSSGAFYTGDKETFWLGFEMAGDREYAFHPGSAAIMGTINATEEVEGREQYTICTQFLPRFSETAAHAGLQAHHSCYISMMLASHYGQMVASQKTNSQRRERATLAFSRCI